MEGTDREEATLGDQNTTEEFYILQAINKRKNSHSPKGLQLTKHFKSKA